MEKTIFNNYYDNRENYTEYAIENIIANGLYDKKEDIPEEEIEREIDYMLDDEWENFKYDMEHYLEDRTLLATGYIGTWRGKLKGGKAIKSFNDLYDLWKDCDYIKFIDDNGLLCLTCTHHDGTNNIEFRELTDKGIEFLENTSLDRAQAHDKVLQTKSYWKLPKYHKVVFGI